MNNKRKVEAKKPEWHICGWETFFWLIVDGRFKGVSLLWYCLHVMKRKDIILLNDFQELYYSKHLTDW